MAARENMTLSCTFQNRDGKRTKVLWLRGSGEDVVLDSNHPFYRGRLHVSSLDEHSQGKATLTLAELQERDSGLYHCCIEIDHGESGMGGGTELRVMWRNQSETDDRKGSKRDSSTELIIYRATIALAGVSIILLVTTLLLRRHTGIYSSSCAHPTARSFRIQNVLLFRPTGARGNGASHLHSPVLCSIRTPPFISSNNNPCLLLSSPDTQHQQPAKGDSRAGGNTSKDLHHAEITFKASAHTEYASIRTWQL
ncbi:uncharacterized protein LOC119842895 isoform X2 [Dermochelys coriacea]|nr:uncharacterized protein LOC119842895 isoform X2 [Dermochelys coriacea]